MSLSLTQLLGTFGSVEEVRTHLPIGRPGFITRAFLFWLEGDEGLYLASLKACDAYILLFD